MPSHEAIDGGQHGDSDLRPPRRREAQQDQERRERQLGAPQSLEVKGLGPAVAGGPLVAALQASDQGLAQLGLAGTMRRVGFQAHDGRIFDRLTARGGVLVAIHSEPRAADALAVLHSYGGGNAAIGAWTGRV